MGGHYKANFQQDIPSPHTPKRVVFYAAALKIYGVLPFVLNRRLGGDFISNAWHGGGGGVSMVCPTGERNYTLVGYQQSEASVHALLDWLYADAGFEWGIAEEFNTPLDHLRQINLLRRPPKVWHLAGAERRGGFVRLLSTQHPGPQHFLQILGG